MALRLEDIWRSMPIITKSFGVACLVTTLAIHLEYVSILQVYLNFHQVIYQLEVWRLLTNFFYFGSFGLNFVFHMCFLIRHAQLLEEGTYRGRTADFLWFLIFGAVSLLGLAFLFWKLKWMHFTPMFLGPSLAFMIVYVWARKNPYMRMSFLGLFTFSAPFLPYVILGLESLFDHHGAIGDILGIIVGHLYYYLEDVYPRLTNRRLLKTPGILKVLFDPADVVLRQQQQQQQQQPQQQQQQPQQEQQEQP